MVRGDPAWHAEYIWSDHPNNDPFEVEISKTELND